MEMKKFQFIHKEDIERRKSLTLLASYLLFGADLAIETYHSSQPIKNWHTGPQWLLLVVELYDFRPLGQQ